MESNTAAAAAGIKDQNSSEEASPPNPELLRDSPPDQCGEPTNNGDISGVAAALRSEVLQLQAAKDLAGTLQGLSSTLEQASSPKEVMESILSALTSLHDLVEDAAGTPEDLPEPCKAGYLGEATLRARFGVTHLTELHSIAVAEQLGNCLSGLESAQNAAQQVCGSLKELHIGLTTYSDAISNAIKNMELLQQKIEALAERLKDPSQAFDIVTGPWKKALGLTAFAFEDLLRKLGCMQADLAPLSVQVIERIRAIQEFVESAREDVRLAFQVPTLACFCQSLTIGKDPSMMHRMLEHLESFNELNLEAVVEVLSEVSDAVCTLRLDRARAAVKNFAACAGRQLNTLDVLLAREQLAESSAQLPGQLPGFVREVQDTASSGAPSKT